MALTYEELRERNKELIAFVDKFQSYCDDLNAKWKYEQKRIEKLEKGYDHYLLQRLKELCDEYDSLHGPYPESTYEGKAIFKYVEARLTPKKGDV